MDCARRGIGLKLKLLHHVMVAIWFFFCEKTQEGGKAQIGDGGRGILPIGLAFEAFEDLPSQLFVNIMQMSIF